MVYVTVCALSLRETGAVVTTFAELPSNLTADGELVRAYLDDGDKNAFAELYERHRRHVLATLLQRVDSGLAHELAQETWARVLQYLHTFDTSRPFWPWVRRIAINLVPGALSQRSGEVPLEDFRAEPALPDPADQFVEYDRVMACLATLPPRQRDALRLRYLEDLDSGTVAELFGVKRNAVEQLLLRARVNLRASFGPRSASVPGVPVLMPRVRRLLEGLATRLQVASTATMSAAGDVAIGAAALTLGTIGLAQGMLPRDAAEASAARSAVEAPGRYTPELPQARGSRTGALRFATPAGATGQVVATIAGGGTKAGARATAADAPATTTTAQGETDGGVQEGGGAPVEAHHATPPLPSQAPEQPKRKGYVPPAPVADDVTVEQETDPDAVDEGGTVVEYDVEYQDVDVISGEIHLADKFICTPPGCVIE